MALAYVIFANIFSHNIKLDNTFIPGSVNGMTYMPQQEVVVKSISRYSTAQAPEGYCYNVDPTQPKSVLIIK